MIHFSKRQKIIAVSLLLSLGLLLSQLVPFYLTYYFIGVLTIFSYLLSLGALWQGISKLKAVMLLILPTLFTLAVSSYYFLLPFSWWIRVPVAVFFGLIFYTLLLSQNVFNVASIRTIPLYRVASTTVFVLTLITSDLLFNVIYSLNLFFLWNGLAVFLLTFPLVLQVVWSIEMERVGRTILVYSFFLAIITGEVALALSFWPISKPMASLVSATTLYIILGISTHNLRERLSRGVVWEYLAWGGLIFSLAIITTSWTG